MFWIFFGFAIVGGGVVGSFLNVVIYRLPAGESVVSPPSHCPKCHQTLAWYDNVPVLGWFFLLGRCRYCGTSISMQYPLVEAIAATAWGGWFLLCYGSGMRPLFFVYPPEMTFAVFVVELFLLSGLIAATMIDAKHYIIPLEITWTVALVALVLLPVAPAVWPQTLAKVGMQPLDAPGVATMTAEERMGVMGWAEEVPALMDVAAVRAEAEVGVDGIAEVCVAPFASEAMTSAAAGAGVGLAMALALLWVRVLPQSFPDLVEEEGAKSGGEPGGDAEDAEASSDGAESMPVERDVAPFDPEAYVVYPGARREAMKELLFIGFPVVGALVGLALLPAGWMDIFGPMKNAMRVVGGVLAGYLIGGGVVWLTRIGGTLGFGKEAMGLGDVHLMAAVGAVAGWPIAVIAFFGAAFVGLAYALLSVVVAAVRGRSVRVLPYGPHLAIATVIVMIWQEPIMERVLVSVDGLAYALQVRFYGV